MKRIKKNYGKFIFRFEFYLCVKILKCVTHLTIGNVALHNFCWFILFWPWIELNWIESDRTEYTLRILRLVFHQNIAINLLAYALWQICVLFFFYIVFIFVKNEWMNEKKCIQNLIRNEKIWINNFEFIASTVAMCVIERNRWSILFMCHSYSQTQTNNSNEISWW